MRRVTNSLGPILLFATALFFMGPQLGSLDTDGDGVPDVPVVAVEAMDAQNIVAPRCGGQGSILRATALLFLERTPTELGFKGSIVRDQRCAGCHCIAPLRC